MPFRFTLTPGQPIFEQVVFAATKAFVSGQLQEGDPFPSVRALAAELKINPNTAAKVVQHLIQEGWLEARPGFGTVVSRAPAPRKGEREKLLTREVEQLVVAARKVGLGREALHAAIDARWRELDSDEDQK